MLKFETINELTLKVTCKGTEELVEKTVDIKIINLKNYC